MVEVNKEPLNIKRALNIQFWTLLGPAFILITLFLTSFAGISNRDLFVFAIGSIALCQKKRQKGLFYSLLILIGLSLFKHYQIATNHLWQLGVEFSLSLGLFISYFSFEHVNELMKAEELEKSDLKSQIEKFEEELKKETDFHQRQHKNFQYEIDRVNFQLEEKKLEIESFKNLVESLKATLSENDASKERLSLQMKEREKQLQILRETIDEYKEQIQSQKSSDDDDLLAELHKVKSEKEKIETFSKSLAKKLEEENLYLREKEIEIEKLRNDNVTAKNKIEELLQIKEKTFAEKESLENSLKNIKENDNSFTQQKELLSQYENKILELKKIESLYYQLRTQFEEKNKTLAEARKELFLTNEKISSIIKSKELQTNDETILEKDLTEQLGKFEYETKRLEEENIHLQDIISSLIRQNDTKEVLETKEVLKEVKKRGRKKSVKKTDETALMEKAASSVSEKNKESDEPLKYTSFEDLP